MPHEEVLGALLFKKECVDALAGVEHHVLVNIFEAGDDSVDVAIARDEERARDRNLVPHLIQVLQRLLQQLVVKSVLPQRPHGLAVEPERR